MKRTDILILRMALAGLVATGCADSTDSRAARDTPEWTLVEELRIGSLDGEDVLTRIGSVSVGPNERVYVTQPQENLIKVFEVDGSLAFSVGREGDGPGEFRSLGEIGWRSDTLYVGDRRTKRVSFFSVEGAFLHSIPLNPEGIESPYFGSPPSRLLSDGTALIMPSFAGEVDGTPLLRTSWDGAVRDTVLWLSQKNSQMTFFFENGLSAGAGRQAFGDNPVTALAVDGSHVILVEREVADTRGEAQYSVHRIEATGDTVATARISYHPVPIPDQVRDSVVALWTERFGPAGRYFPSARAARRAVEEALYSPPFYPPVTTAALSEDGAVWVIRRRVVAGGTPVDVVIPEEGLIARVEVPAGMSIGYLEPDRLWATTTDELGVPYLVRYRIER